MIDNLEQRLRDAFEASAASVTPDSLDTQREHEMRQLLADAAASPEHGPRRGVLAAIGGLAAAAAVAGVVVITHPSAHPLVAGDPLSAPRTSLRVGSPSGTVSPSASTAPTATGSSTPSAQLPPVAPHSSSAAARSTPPPAPTSTAPDKRAASSTGLGAPSTAYGSTTPAKTQSPTSTAASSARSAGPTTGSQHGPLPIPVDLQAASGMQSLPMPPAVGYTVLSSTNGSATVHVDNTMQLLRYWDQHSPLGTWTRDAAGNYDDPSSTMVIGYPLADATGDGGTFTIQAGTGQ